MIPVTQTKVSVKNSKGEDVVRGNCYAAVVASMMELPITEVPNVEVLFDIKGSLWSKVMLSFIASKGWDLCTDERYRIFHDQSNWIDEETRTEYLHECIDKFYLVSGDSPRGIRHIVIFKNGKLVHDPHPTRDGLIKIDTFQTLEKIK